MPETRTHNAKDILTEALDTIKATYWIQEAEVRFAPVELWDEHEKAILADLSDEDWHTPNAYCNPSVGDKAKVIGVCSVGAIALANVTLYDEPLLGFDNIVNRDIETWKAGQALAQTINETTGGYLREDAGPVIATWNDKPERTREEVVAIFEQALASPLLGATEFYEVVADKYYGAVKAFHFFTTEEEAQRFVDTPSPLRDFYAMTLGVSPAELYVRPYTHPSLVAA